MGNSSGEPISSGRQTVTAGLTAIESGELPGERLASYHKLLREARAAAMKTDVHLRAEETRKWKVITKWYKNHPKNPGKR